MSLRVCCLPSLPKPDEFKVRLFLDDYKVEYVKSHADLRVWCDNRPRKDVRRMTGDVNGEMIDSSKSWLETNVRKAFGYGYAVNPQQWRGPAVEKYQWHARHPKVIQCPAKPQHRHFYSELLTGIEWRIAVFARSLVCTFTKREIGHDGLGSAKRIDGSSRYDVPWEEVMAKTERDKFFRLCELLGLNYGEFDVIRHTDGRFCPIDVNPSPFPPSPHSFTKQDFAKIIPHESKLFQIAFL